MASSQTTARDRDFGGVSSLQRITDVMDIERAANNLVYQQEQNKWPRYLQWFENTSMLLGNHLGRWHYSSELGLGTTIGTQNRNSFSSMVAKTASNHLIRPHENVIGMMTEAEIEPRVTRNDDTPDSNDAAEIAEIVLQLHFEKPMNLGSIKSQLQAVVNLYGTAIAETEYGDTNFPVEIPKFIRKVADNPLFDPSSPEDETMNPKQISQEVESGTETVSRQGMNCRVWTPFHFTPDPAATSEDDMIWISRHSFVDRNYVFENFIGKESDGYVFSDVDILDSSMTSEHATKYGLFWWLKVQDIIESPQNFQNGGGFSSQAGLADSGIHPDQILFRVIDVKPSQDHPRGRTLVFAGEKLVYKGDSRSWSEKYPERWHPYSFHRWMQVPGRFWGVAMLSQLVPLQKKINAIDVLVHKNRQFMAIGQYYLPRHAKVRPGSMTGIPGVHIDYTDVPGMTPPRRVENQPLPADLWQEKDVLKRDILDISATGTVDDSVSPSAARAGSMMEFFKSERIRGKTQMIQSFERCLEGIAQNTLIDLQLHLTEDDPTLTALIRSATTEFSTMSMAAFTGASLRDHHAVKIDVGSKLRHSPEAKAERALQFLQARGQAATPVEVGMALDAAGLGDYAAGKQDASRKKGLIMIARIFSNDPDQLKGVIAMPSFESVGVLSELFNEAVLSDRFHDLEEPFRNRLLELADGYNKAVEQEQEQQRQRQMQMLLAEKGQLPGRSQQ